MASAKLRHNDTEMLAALRQSLKDLENVKLIKPGAIADLKASLRQRIAGLEDKFLREECAMAIRNQPLNEKLKHLGFAPGNRMRLYGEIFEMANDPIVVNESLVLMDAVETRSGEHRRLRIPLPVLRMASESKKAA